MDTVQSLEEYHKPENQQIVNAAAQLVDDGRAGTLSRLQEIIEFSKLMNYSKLGIAYCYAMENEALLVAEIIRDSGLKINTVSCTCGGLSQDKINLESEIQNVSCNPITQASQLNIDKTEFVITMGLCLGHDILFQKYIQAPNTVLIVKDRVNNHNPLNEIIKINKNERNKILRF